MNICFEKLQMHNVMSMTDAFINLNVPGYVFVFGENNNKEDNSKSNGVGKSTAFEMLLWVLTGETQRGISGKDVLKIGESEGFATLWFTVDGDKYEITRGISSSQSLTIIKNGVDISGKGIKASTEVLKDLFPELTLSLLSNIVILGQGLPGKLSSQTPSGRKEVLEKLFKADFMIEDIKERINNRLTDLKSEQRVIEDNILSNTSKLEIIKVSLQNDKSSLNDLEEPDDLQTKLSELKRKVGELSENKSAIVEQNNTILSKNKEINEKLLKLSEKKLETNNSDYLVAELEEIKEKGVSLKNDIILLDKEIESKDKITDICPTCGQKMIGIEKPDTTEDKKKSAKMKETLNELRSQLQELKDSRKEYLDKQLSEIDKQSSILKGKLKEIIDASSLDRELSSLNSEISNITAQISAFDVKKSELENSITENERQIASLEIDIHSFESDKLLVDNKLEVVNKINSLVKRDFRGYLLSNIIVVLNTTCKDYAKEVFGHNNLSIEQVGNNIAITANGKEYAMLSGGEKQKVDVIVQLGIKTVLEKYMGITTNILVLDEVTDSLDVHSAETLLNMITNKISIPTVFMISHHQEFPIPHDSKIKVIKGQKGSTVIQI